ncbi:MAG: hypothetical protein KA268_01645 [Bacteroidales bacterium]|jgi:hypothetical protein|nr:hypothetical protein [Bacteroidales bacterium]
MKEKFNMENKHLRENPYSVPEGYFNNLQDTISERVASGKRGSSFWSVARPQLALVTSFAIIFLIAYATINIFSPGKADETLIVTETDPVEGLYIKTSFVDFYDSTADSLYAEEEKEIDPEEIIDYLSTNTGLIYLASID